MTENENTKRVIATGKITPDSTEITTAEDPVLAMIHEIHAQAVAVNESLARLLADES